MNNTAAILLCAGKGTRMGQSDRSKVAYDCAGVPVIKRIVRNMREGGVTRFVVVVGHMAESVMSALADEPGVLYAYQKEQKGTGHAAACGLSVLNDIGFTGRVIISMGDKIVAPRLVRGLLASENGEAVSSPLVSEAQNEPTADKAHGAHSLTSGKDSASPLVRAAPKATIGVQPNPGNTSKGHVIVRNGRVLGIIEAKDIRRAREAGTTLSLCGQTFTPDEVEATPYVNAALYAFDVQLLGEALKTLRPDNAQGELYLTDVVEWFASRDAGSEQVERKGGGGQRTGGVSFYIAQPEELLTYSTKTELRAMSRTFLRRASEFLSDATSQEADRGVAPEERCSHIASCEISRMGEAHLRSDILSRFIAKYGDRPCIIASAPGRINLMGRHIEHRGGSTNMMATNQRMTFVVSPREDDVVHISNLDPAFPDAEFRMSDYLHCPPPPLLSTCSASTATWLDFLDSPAIKADLDATKGHWINYVKSAVLRFQLATDAPLCGMDIMASGDIPVAAGLSSSSALVVSTAEAVVALNALNLTTREFVDLCGEGEWYVGSRGGAGDHAAMKCSQAGRITHLKFKPFEIGESVPFPKDYSIIVVNSGEMAKKSEGAKETFNARIRDYETAFNEVKRHYPELPITYFRDLAFLPEKDQTKALACLTGTTKGVALFGIKECRRAEDCLTLLKNHDYVALGEMMKASHDGDRLGTGEYECSTRKIDALCDTLNATPGVLGSQLVGAGLGGCIIALVEKSAASSVLASLAQSGYTAFSCEPSFGSKVEY